MNLLFSLVSFGLTITALIKMLQINYQRKNKQLDRSQIPQMLKPVLIYLGISLFISMVLQPAFSFKLTVDDLFLDAGLLVMLQFISPLSLYLRKYRKSDTTDYAKMKTQFFKLETETYLFNAMMIFSLVIALVIINHVTIICAIFLLLVFEFGLGLIELMLRSLIRWICKTRG